MKTRHGRSLALAAVLTIGACASGSEAVDAAGSSAPISSDAGTTAPSETAPGPEVQDIWSSSPSRPIEPGIYFIDPDLDPSTPLRVVYEVPAEGWSMWVGGASSVTMDTSA